MNEFTKDEYVGIAARECVYIESTRKQLEQLADKQPPQLDGTSSAKAAVEFQAAKVAMYAAQCRDSYKSAANAANADQARQAALDACRLRGDAEDSHSIAVGNGRYVQIGCYYPDHDSRLAAAAYARGKPAPADQVRGAA